MLLTATYAAVFVRHKHPRAWFAAMRRVSRPIQSSQSAVDGCNEVRRYGGQEQKQPGDGPDSGPIRMRFPSRAQPDDRTHLATGWPASMPGVPHREVVGTTHTRLPKGLETGRFGGRLHSEGAN